MIKRFTLFVLAGVAGLLVVMAVAGAVFLFTPFGRGRTEPGSDAGAERTSEQEIPESEREIPDEEIAEAEGREQSDEPPDNSLTILLAGRKGRLTDSMLLLHIDGPDEVARILTIPRDLWYGGYKINERYYHRGGEAMMKAVGDLTGYEPDHFAVVNMDGFVEIIDHLGGIEITLDEPLRDDVIRVPEGQGPLDYDAGTHTVSGEEALLIARSRATTDDFDRAQRQTRIIEGVQDRLSELAFGDIPALYRIGRTVYEYVDTDVSIARAVGYFLDYGIIDEFERSGLTVDNVLENSHSAYLPDDEVAYRSEWPEDMEELVRRRDPETVEAERQGYGGNKAARLAWLTRRDEDDLEAAWQELRASYQSDEDDTEDEDDTAGEASTESEANTDSEDDTAGEASTESGDDTEGDGDSSDSEASSASNLSPQAFIFKRRVVEATGVLRTLPARGAWLLRPVEDDWDHTRWYAQEFFENGGPDEESLQDRLADEDRR